MTTNTQPAWRCCSACCPQCGWTYTWLRMWTRCTRRWASGCSFSGWRCEVLRHQRLWGGSRCGSAEPFSWHAMHTNALHEDLDSACKSKHPRARVQPLWAGLDPCCCYGRLPMLYKEMGSGCSTRGGSKSRWRKAVCKEGRFCRCTRGGSRCGLCCTHGCALQGGERWLQHAGGSLTESPCTLLSHAAVYKEAGTSCHGQMQPL